MILGNTAQIDAHALLEAVSVMLHKNSLTCDSKPAEFLYNLTKNLTAQSVHLNCAVLPLLHQFIINLTGYAIGCDRTVIEGYFRNAVIVAAEAVKEAVVKHLLNG